MGKDKNDDKKEKKLTESEIKFCELYVFGGKKFAGQAIECYQEVYGEGINNVSLLSQRLLHQPHITKKIKELASELQTETESIALKLQITETLKGVMKETSTVSFIDKFGVSLSPAPLRAVSVNAAKALMDLYPIKAAQEVKLKGDNGNGGVIFNVIVPEAGKKDEKEIQ